MWKVLEIRRHWYGVLPPVDGVIRFTHIKQGGINPRQGYTDYKLLLNIFRNAGVGFFCINELNLDTV